MLFWVRGVAEGSGSDAAAGGGGRGVVRCVESKLAEERRIEPGHWVLLLRAADHHLEQQEQEEEPKLAKVVQVRQTPITMASQPAR